MRDDTLTSVSFQGEHGAYSEGAAITYFEDDITTKPRETFAKVVESVENKEDNFGILPVENSIQGSVSESIDAMLDMKLNVIGEMYHKIVHCLIGNGGLRENLKVYSHPQALGQCKKFIQRYNMKAITAYDTAGSVSLIKELESKDTVCIAGENAAHMYNIPIIKRDIADNTNNYTRFLILADETTEETGQDKTSITFSIKHEKSALYKIMRIINQYGTNLTKIESRPLLNHNWEYNFFVDFEGHQKNQRISQMLNEIKQNTSYFQILGSYKMNKII